MNLVKNIESIIPQRSPFVMIGELLQCSEMLAVSAFEIKEENFFIENGKFSEAGMIENIAQTAAAHAGYLAAQNNEKIKKGYIAAVKNLQIFSLPKINEKIITEIKIEHQIFNAAIISGNVFCNDKLIATCEMKIFVQEVSHRAHRENE